MQGDTTADRVRAVVALGDLQDCVVVYPDLPAASIREAAIGAGLRALLPVPGLRSPAEPA
ncbi:MAG: hypothetical protein ACRDRH_21355 [Pseudonocardia sp.]